MTTRICAVTLISDQTIPNVIFLKWCLQQYFSADIDVICLSTEKMESENKHKSDNIKKALGNEIDRFKNFKTIKIDEFNRCTIQQQLQDSIDNCFHYYHFVVDITGGTKIMSLATYLYFAPKAHTQILYQPIGKNTVNKLSPTEHESSINISVNLHEYFTAYGIEVQFGNRCEKTWEDNQKVVSKIEKYFETYKKLVCIQNINSFKKKVKKAPIDIYRLSEQQMNSFNQSLLRESYSALTVTEFCDFVQNLGFNPNAFTYSNLKYTTGGWFEEYVYQTIQKSRNLREDTISLNVKIKIQNTDNELDVVFIDERNSLNIIECKSFIDEDEKEQSDILNNAIYKIQALRSNFGLSVRCFLYTMSAITKPSILNRAKNFNITIIDRSKCLQE